MSAAWAVLGADARTFQVEAGQGPVQVRLALAGPAQHREALEEILGRGGDQGRTQPGQTVPPALPDDRADFLDRQPARAKGDAQAAVDLEVEQRRRQPTGLEIGALRARRGDGRYEPVPAAQADRL